MKCDDTCAETRFRLSAKRTSPFKSAGASVQSTTGSRGVRISISNVGYTKFRGSVKGTWLPTPFASFPFTPPPPPCVTMCHHISTGLYNKQALKSGLLWNKLYTAFESYSKQFLTADICTWNCQKLLTLLTDIKLLTVIG